MRRYIVIPDQHHPLVDPRAWSCVLQAIGVIKPDGFINLGDVGEWEAASHWQWKKKRRPPLEYQLSLVDKDIIAANRFQDQIDEALDKANVSERHICEGNHDDWLNRLVEENPFLADTKHPCGEGYTFRQAMGWDRRGYNYHREGSFLKIGHMRFYHGHHYKTLVYHPRTHLQNMGCNVMYAHFHSIKQDSVSHIDGEKAAWCIGCLKRLDREANEFMRGRASNWGHAFATVDYWGDDFQVNMHRIVDGKVSIYGELIKGKGKRFQAAVA